MYMLEVFQEHRRSGLSITRYGSNLCVHLNKEFTPDGESNTASSRILLILPFTVPALLYTVTNNLGIMIQMEMDPATYQVI